MGYGDQLMATGMARGAAARGKRIAFGENGKILWDHYSDLIFRDNPNIAPPGSEGAHDLEWIRFFRGQRKYNRHDVANNRWVWNLDFRPIPGEMFLLQKELSFAPKGSYIVVEPYSSNWKVQSINKQWPIPRFVELIRLLKKQGIKIVQVINKNNGQLPGTEVVVTPTFREAAAVISKAQLFIGSEGGLHHAAAAFRVPAVVIFGGWIPPQVTGYDFHENISIGDACGHLFPCPHCQQVMNNISVNQVYQAANKLFKENDHVDTPSTSCGSSLTSIAQTG